MVFKNLWIKLASTSLLIAVSFNAFAFDCNEKSPAFIKEGDKYFNITNAKSLTKKQKANVTRIFSPLKKRLKGKGVVTTCIEQEGQTTKVESNEKLSADVKFLSNGQLDIQLEAYDKENKNSSTISLNYFGDNGYHSLLKQTRKSFGFIYKIRTSVRGRPAALNEKLITLSVNRGVLTIETHDFFNGYFSYSTKRVLRP